MRFLKKKYLLVPLMSTVLLAACGNDGQTEEPVGEPEEELAETPAEMEEEAAESVEDVEGGETEEITAQVAVFVEGEEQVDLTQSFEVFEGTVLSEIMIENYEVVEENGFVESLEGFEQNPEEDMYWMYYVNGEAADVGMNDYVLQDNDEVEWRLEGIN